MTNAPTTRETADHAELVRLAEACGGKVCWTATRTGLSEYRNVSFYIYDGATMLAETNGDTPHVAAFIAAANPATVLALLSEIAALRGSVSLADRAADAMADRATQAERQRDELLNAWRDDGIDLEDFGRIVARLANQGAEPAPVKKERAWICPQDNTPCPPECDSDDRRHCASVACREQPE